MAREAYHQTHRFKGEIEPGLTETGTYDPPGTFSNACHVAIVEVDVETGRVTIEKFLVAEDAGRIINPMIADGQVHGGIAQGIGNALLEEIIYDESGGILTANLADYMPPTAREIPPIELHHIETPSTQSITKAKGLGEGGCIGAPAAVDQRHQRRAVAVRRRRSTRCRRRRSASARRCAQRGEARMTDKAAITLTINGRDHAISVEPRRTLADAIREDCGQTGTHIGCEHGVCGACTVIVDGEPVRSCLMFAVQAEGKPIRTVEGLAQRRQAASDAAGLHGAPRPAMRLLHAGLPDAGGRRARARARHQRRGPARRAVVEPVPLHRLPEHHQGRRARRPKADARDNDAPPAEIRRPLRPASGRPAAAARPGPLRRRHFVSRPMAHARGALGRRARQDQIDRCDGRARAAGRARGVDRCRRGAHSADPVSPHRHRRARRPTGSRCWPTDVVRYVGEPVAVVFADDPYLAEDAAELVEVDDRTAASNAARDRATGRLRA